MLRKSMRKLLALIVAVVIGLLLLRWLAGQSRIEAGPAGSQVGRSAQAAPAVGFPAGGSPQAQGLENNVTGPTRRCCDLVLS